MLPYYRKTLLPGNIAGLDSVQGILEMASGYSKCGFHIGGTADGAENPHSPQTVMNRLEKEGYIEAQWVRDANNADRVILSDYWLTVKGYELLHTLQERSKTGRWKRRFGDLSWIIITSALTTILTLYVRSCAIGSGG